jgi:hypothetical protein
MAYWRIRMTFGPTKENLTKDVWEKGIIGIWYGAWNPSDLLKCSDQSPTNIARSLSLLPAQRKLGKKVKKEHVHSIQRFEGITPEDWVFVYYDQSLHIARVDSAILANDVKEFAREGELFKARKIREAKTFRLDQLPESFRLLSCAGRGTIHELGATRSLVQMLAENNSAKSVNKAYRRLSWGDWLDALGPKGWETICLAYLIQEKQFVPTGLGVGGTLADFDIVGRDKSGKRVLAQCKKTPNEHVVEDREQVAYIESKNADVYLFAYKGARNIPGNVILITKRDIDDWFLTPSGQQYSRQLTAD